MRPALIYCTRIRRAADFYPLAFYAVGEARRCDPPSVMMARIFQPPLCFMAFQVKRPLPCHPSLTMSCKIHTETRKTLFVCARLPWLCEAAGCRGLMIILPNPLSKVQSNKFSVGPKNQVRELDPDWLNWDCDRQTDRQTKDRPNLYFENRKLS